MFWCVCAQSGYIKRTVIDRGNRWQWKSQFSLFNLHLNNDWMSEPIHQKSYVPLLFLKNKICWIGTACFITITPFVCSSLYWQFYQTKERYLHECLITDFQHLDMPGVRPWLNTSASFWMPDSLRKPVSILRAGIFVLVVSVTLRFTELPVIFALGNVFWMYFLVQTVTTHQDHPHKYFCSIIFIQTQKGKNPV